LSLINQSTFLHFQKHCPAPVVEEVWRDMNNVVKQIFKAYEDICLCRMVGMIQPATVPGTVFIP